MIKKLISGQILQMLVIPLVISYILSQCPWIIAMSVTNVSYLRGRTVYVTGTVEFLRDNENWYGPDSLPYFQEWWNINGPETVYKESKGLIKLVSIEWIVIEEKENSDVLAFGAVIEVQLNLGIRLRGFTFGV